MEQALVFASIVLGVAVASELNNLHKLLQSNNVKWHWAQLAYALLTLLTMMSVWWMLANVDLTQKISLAGFLPAMWVLVLLNLMAAVALPDWIPEDGVDLAEYYQEKRRYLWGLYLLAIAPLGGSTYINAFKQADGAFRFVELVAVDTFAISIIVMLFFARAWWLVGLGFAIFFSITTLWLVRTI